MRHIQRQSRRNGKILRSTGKDNKVGILKRYKLKKDILIPAGSIFYPSKNRLVLGHAFIEKFIRLKRIINDTFPCEGIVVCQYKSTDEDLKQWFEEIPEEEEDTLK